MSDYDTGNPVPSNDPRDLDDNATNFDRLLLLAVPSVPDRLGTPRKTWWQMEQDAAALVSPNVSALAALAPAIDLAFFFNATSPVGMGSYTLSSFTRGLGPLTTQSAYRSAIGAIALTDTGAFSGSAAKLSTARDISASGDASWTVSFDGSANTTAALTLAATGVTAGTYNTITVDAKGRATGGNLATAMATLTLVNSWVVISGRRAAWRKVTADLVFLEIQIQNGTSTDGTTLTTLPVGSRPANTVVVPVSSGPNTTPSSSIPGPRVIINTDGTIVCQNCTGAVGLSFTATFSTI